MLEVSAVITAPLRTSTSAATAAMITSNNDGSQAPATTDPSQLRAHQAHVPPRRPRRPQQRAHDGDRPGKDHRCDHQRDLSLHADEEVVQHRDGVEGADEHGPHPPDHLRAAPLHRDCGTGGVEERDVLLELWDHMHEALMDQLARIAGPSCEQEYAP